MNPNAPQLLKGQYTLNANFSSRWFLFILGLCTALLSVAEDQLAVEKNESPLLLVPTFSSDPKLGTSVGVLGGYLFRFDDASEQSLIAFTASYSDNDSWMGGVFGTLFFDQDIQRLTLGIGRGKINNNYEDFLGTGLNAATTDRFNGEFLRYTYQLLPSWHFGGQWISSNYTVGAENMAAPIFDHIGEIGFDSNGIGAVVEYDTRDNTRNATDGSHLLVHNTAYRESLGGQDSFDTYQAEYTHYIPHIKNNVFALQVKGRWTNDAPVTGYSSIDLRGYVRGNYLAPNYTHIDLEERIHITGRWGMSIFAGVGCLYDNVADCDDSKNIYPAAGVGVLYELKKEAGVVLRAELAKGESEDYSAYIKIGSAF